MNIKKHLNKVKQSILTSFLTIYIGIKIFVKGKQEGL